MTDETCCGACGFPVHATKEMACDWCRQSADRIEALEAKLAAAVDWFETIRDRAKGDYMAHTYYLDAIAALTTIKKETPNE